ncbi:MAG: hypothetical protein JW891_13320 [Candidatus Lokiarchaeota archaeon]|nr:hypothetical protein [Candidatus Lokiarchaeota archaeon]
MKFEKERIGSIIALIGVILLIIAGLVSLISALKLDADLNLEGQSLSSFDIEPGMLIDAFFASILLACVAIIGIVIGYKANKLLTGGFLCVLIGIIVFYFGIIQPAQIIDTSPPLNYVYVIRTVPTLYVDPFLMIVGGALSMYFGKKTIAK